MSRSRTRDDKIEVRIGRNLRRLREKRNLSQTELGDEFGISFQQIQKYESGKNRMGASLLYRAAGVLNVRLSHFFK
jgi:transcriptional regulator with XRE-family HTH domain